MKKNLLLIIGVLVFVIIVATAGFVFIKNKTNDDDTTETTGKFFNFNVDDERLNKSDIESDDNMNNNDTTGSADNNDNDLALNENKLKQITTTPVAGFNLIKNSYFGEDLIYYIRVGTGNIFYSDPKNNNFDNKISNTTIKNTHAGAISNSGRFAAVVANESGGRNLVVGEISTSTKSINFKEIAKNVTQVYAVGDNDFMYTVKSKDGFLLRYYYPISDISETVFSLPFREAQVNFNNIKNSRDIYFAYPKASKYLDGLVYAVNGGNKERLPISGPALSAAGNKKFFIYSLFDNKNNDYNSYVYDTITRNKTELGFFLLPEKCINVKEKILCAVSFQSESRNLPDSWYKGLENLSDKIVIIDNNVGVTIKNLLMPEKITGQKLDIIDLTTDQDNKYLLFKDKKKRTLWQYQLPEEWLDDNLN